MKVGGICVFVFAGGYVASRALSLNRSKTYLINACAVFIGYLCSTTWYLIQNHFGGDLDPIFPLRETWGMAGAVLYGWTLGGTATIFLLTRRYKILTIRYLDIVLPWLLVAQAMNRLGCYDAGCCFGKMLPNGAFIPVQLIESVYDLALSAFIWRIAKRQGLPTFYYFVGYPAARFLFEFLRGDNGPALLFMTVPQVTSVLILAAVFSFKKRILSQT
jgi:prolipoprotein diacylglyceryltransferase